MAVLEEHPVFNPAIKISSQQQNEKKKAPSAQPQETTLNLSLLEKPDGAAKEDKGMFKVVQYKLEVYHIFKISYCFSELYFIAVSSHQMPTV